MSSNRETLTNALRVYRLSYDCIQPDRLSQVVWITKNYHDPSIAV